MRAQPVRYDRYDDYNIARNEQSSLQEIVGHLNQRISMDQSLLEKIKQI